MSRLGNKKIYIELNDDECDSLDSIYLTSKYPVGSVLPDFYPDYEITKNCLTIAQQVFEKISDELMR